MNILEIAKKCGIEVRTPDIYYTEYVASPKSLEAFAKEIAEQSLSRWISVKDRLPEDDNFVDIFVKSTENEGYGVRKTSKLFKDSIFVSSVSSRCEYVSHWAPITEPPKD